MVSNTFIKKWLNTQPSALSKSSVWFLWLFLMPCSAQLSHVWNGKLYDCVFGNSQGSFYLTQSSSDWLSVTQSQTQSVDWLISLLNVLIDVDETTMYFIRLDSIPYFDHRTTLIKIASSFQSTNHLFISQLTLIFSLSSLFARSA